MCDDPAYTSQIKSNVRSQIAYKVCSYEIYSVLYTTATMYTTHLLTTMYIVCSSDNKINNYCLYSAVSTSYVSVICGGDLWSGFCDGARTPVRWVGVGGAEVFFLR